MAIKILKPECVTAEMQRDFAQEVFIMRFFIYIALYLIYPLILSHVLKLNIGTCRKVRHKNVVQFIGACTKPPSLCIVTGKFILLTYRIVTRKNTTKEYAYTRNFSYSFLSGFFDMMIILLL